MPGRLVCFLWLAWVAVLAASTAGVFKWHLDYFGRPGPQYQELAVFFIPGLALAAWTYAALRRRGVWRYEFLAFGLLIAAATIGYEPKAAALTAAVFVSIGVTGRLVLNKLGLNLHHPLERIALSCGTGAGILISVLFVVGLLKALYPFVLLAVLALPLVVGWSEVRATLFDITDLHRRWQAAVDLRHPLTGVAIMIGWVAAICTLMMVLAPSIAFDAVALHLPSVQYYAAHHQLAEVPGIDYSLYPQGMELLWTLAYSLAGQPAAQMISALFFLLFLMSLVQLARESGLNAGAAITAAAFAATLPFLHWTGSVMKNDLTLALFEALAVLTFLRWLEGRDFRWIALGTFFLAQAFGVKHIAIFAAVPLIAFYTYAVWKARRRIRWTGVLVAVFLVFGTGWAIRAYVLSGNPVAPDRLRVLASGSLEIHERTFAGKAWKYAQIPWMLLFHGQDSFESPLESPAGILLFACAPLALLVARSRSPVPGRVVCAIFTVLYLIFWAWILTKVRYAILPFALLGMFAALWMHIFYGNGRSGILTRIVRRSLVAVETYCLLIALMGLMIVGVNAPQFAYFTGRLDKTGYLRSAMEAYGAVEFLHHIDNPHARVFGVQNLARAYAPDPYVFDASFCGIVKPCEIYKVAEEAWLQDAEYLILPENGTIDHQALLERMGGHRRVYSDRFFSVYRLTR